MKKTTIIILLLSVFSIIACSDQKKSSKSSKDVLIEKLIDHSKAKGKIAIIGKDFCKDNDCVEYFIAYQDKVQVYTMEDAFMKGITDYVVITEFNEEIGTMKFYEKKDGKINPVEFNLGE